jgi:hypothetical protein
MNRRCRVAAAVAVAALAAAGPASAGGAWVPAPGRGDVQLGASRKMAHTSWDSHGNAFTNTGRAANHDFRYAYLSGEFGLVRRLSGTFVVTYLDGFEGPAGNPTENAGLSDAWFGLKFSLRQGQAPMALTFTTRTPVFYDIKGPYTRDLYDSQGNFLGESPEWRGLLKHDYTLSYLYSRSLWRGRGWVNAETGYTWREGAPSDQVPVAADAGIPLRWHRCWVKVSLLYVQSVGNDSPRQPDDRFGARSSFNFNDASMLRGGASILVPFGRGDRWSLEAGYNRWLWGRSARRYQEPFLSLGRSF